MTIYLLSLRATACVEASSPALAVTAWEEGHELETEIDTESGVHGIEILEDYVPSQSPRTVFDAAALDMIQSLLDQEEWSADTTDQVANIVRLTGRSIGDVPEFP